MSSGTRYRSIGDTAAAAGEAEADLVESGRIVEVSLRYRIRFTADDRRRSYLPANASLEWVRVLADEHQNIKQDRKARLELYVKAGITPPNGKRTGA